MCKCKSCQSGRGCGGQRGYGLVSSVRSGVRKYGPRVKQYIKKQRLISKGLAYVAPYSGQYAPFVTAGSMFAAQRGWGRGQYGSGRYLAGFAPHYGP